MHLVQVFLPLRRNDGEPFAKALYRQVRSELVERHGGLTAYTRSPADGLWQEEGGDTVADQLVIYEVMVEHLDTAWWKSYRAELERRFQQDAILMRATAIEPL